MPPPNFTVPRMQLSLNASPSFLHTFLAQSDFTRLNFDSSVHKTFFQNDNGMFTYFLANASLRSRWVFERNGFLRATLALNPLFQSISNSKRSHLNSKFFLRTFGAFDADKNRFSCTILTNFRSVVVFRS